MILTYFPFFTKFFERVARFRSIFMISAQRRFLRQYLAAVFLISSVFNTFIIADVAMVSQDPIPDEIGMTDEYSGQEPIEEQLSFEPGPDSDDLQGFEDAQELPEEAVPVARQPERIKNIVVEGNKSVSADAIRSAVPYQVGEAFSQRKTNKLIRNVYDLGFFKNVQVFAEPVDENEVNLVVVVAEKRALTGVEYKGNKHLSEKEIQKKIDFAKVHTVDELEIPKYEKILKRLYRDKDYHGARVAGELDSETGKLHFTIDEKKRTVVKRVRFTGNEHITGKKLRSMMFTREDWVMGFMDRSGSYQPEAIESDKYVLENYYQSCGFLNAKVTDVSVDREGDSEFVNVTFHIREGDQYCISEIRVPGNDVLPEETLLARIPIRVGQLYSRDRIRESIEALRVMWGEYGYINADIEPSIQPDDEKKTVSLAFYTELGPKVKLNRVNVHGNEKTHDKIIRRQLSRLEEGRTLTTQAMDEGKNKVELLGYFDQRDGVNWKMNRVNEELVDLDLMVREVKTGRIEGKIGFGGSQKDFTSPMESVNVGFNVSETNLFGRGLHVNLGAEYSKEERNLIFNITEPWLFDRPIHSSFDLYHKRSLYDEFKLINEHEINERITGMSLSAGFLSAKLYDTTLAGKLGVEGISYKNPPTVRAAALSPREVTEFQGLLDKRFTSGTFLFLGGYATQDIRNHPMHPSRGYQWLAQTKIAIHSAAKGKTDYKFGFFKLDVDASWYTPLIGERELVLCLHGHLGLVAPFKNRTIPFRELYHIGGPASVRGFLFAEIGPMWRSTTMRNKSDALGAKKAFWVNAELIFPISRDFSMKGAVFYDGGAGWDTPDGSKISLKRLIKNEFDYRHSVGIGIRVLRPTPVKIDWGFKLDRRKGESPSEVHFSMYHEF